MRLTAIRYEARLQEQATFDELLGVLTGKPSGQVTVREATSGLAHFWDSKKVSRSAFAPLLDHESDEVRKMAMAKLGHEPKSRAKILGIMNDPSESVAIRSKSMDTLRAKTDHWKDLWGIVERKTESSTMRTAAMQWLDVMLRKHRANPRCPRNRVAPGSTLSIGKWIACLLRFEHPFFSKGTDLFGYK